MVKEKLKGFIVMLLKSAYAEILPAHKMTFAMQIAGINLSKLTLCQMAKFAYKLVITDSAIANQNLVIRFH